MAVNQGSNLASVVKANLRALMSGVLLDAFNDPRTVDIMVNPDGKLYVEKLGQGKQLTGKIKPELTANIIRAVAGFHNDTVSEDNPICEGEFPLDGSRFEGMIPPVVQGPSFDLRKKAIMVFTLDDYVKAGTMSKRQKEIICEAVANKKNILVVGGTGSGKTTLVNAIIAEIVAQFPLVRPVIIEDTGEIQCTAEDHVQMRATAKVSMTRLLKATLRYNPDRILVGEVRGPEAFDLLNAWNTGHPGGCATLHSDTAESGLSRLMLLISEHPSAPRQIEPLVGEAVNVVVNIERTPGGRRIRSIIKVNGWDDKKGEYRITDIQ